MKISNSSQNAKRCLTRYRECLLDYSGSSGSYKIIYCNYFLTLLLIPLLPSIALSLEPSDISDTEYIKSKISVIKANLSMHDFTISADSLPDQTVTIQACYACHIQNDGNNNRMTWIKSNDYTVQFASTSDLAIRSGSGYLNEESQMCMDCHSSDIDINHSHPVSVNYLAATLRGGFKQLDSDIPLGRNGTVECISCHDPHNNEYGNYLRVRNNRSALCQKCHDK